MSGPFARYAARLLDLGYSPVPIREGTKRPLFEHWDMLRGKPLRPSQIAVLNHSHPNLGLGVAGGFNCLVPLDIDTNEPSIKRAILGAIPKPIVAKVGAKGFTSFYWDESGLIEGMKFKSRDDFFAEVLVTGQSVLPPTIHPDTLLPYKWLTSKTLFNMPIDQLPVISASHINALRAALQPWLPKPEEHALRLTYSDTISTDNKMRAYAKTALRNEAKRLSALSCGRNWGLFASACKLGRFVYHNALSQSEVEKVLMQATEANGYTCAKHGGRTQAWKTLQSGLKKARGDSLPDLSVRHS